MKTYGKYKITKIYSITELAPTKIFVKLGYLVCIQIRKQLEYENITFHTTTPYPLCKTPIIQNLFYNSFIAKGYCIDILKKDSLI